MIRIARIAYRNLLRYSRRTLLTSILITIGIASVLLFIAIAGTFKQLMIGQITDSMLGHIQVHRKGYVSSIDNSPLDLNLTPKQLEKLNEALAGEKQIASFSPRLKFSGMLSSYQETANIRLNGVIPEMENKTVPLLIQRVKGKSAAGETSLNPGEVWIPETLAKGMNLSIGSQIVLVATNQEGSVNGMQLTVSGIVEAMTGPGGRDGYLHLQDARQLLRIRGEEVNEVAVRLADFDGLEQVMSGLNSRLAGLTNKKGKPVFEIHTWSKLAAFSTVVNVIHLLTKSVKVVLIAIVLVSIMIVMLMAVYERIREIGTIAAMGTTPGRIRALFLMEGLFLGLFGASVGTVVSLAVIQVLRWKTLTLAFGRQVLTLMPSVSAREVLITALIVVVISALASLQPALKASRLEPVDALRHN